MIRRRFAFLGLLPCLAALAVACSATNGGFVPEPLYSPDDAGTDETKLPDTGTDPGPGPTDAGTDAKKADADSSAPPGPSPADVRIQELYVDHDGLGDGAEYVELRGAPGTPVDSLRLRLIDDVGNLDYEVPVGEAGAVIGASGTWVVAGPQTFRLGVTDRVDQTVQITQWGIANGRGAIQLVRGANRELLDVVGYVNDPDAGAVPPPVSTPKATSEGLPAIVPTIAKRALGRKAAAADTNDNRADFCSMVPTPGSSQQKPCD